MNIEKIKQFAQVSSELKSDENVIAIRLDFQGCRVHVQKEALVTIENLKIKNRDESTYSYEIYTMIDDINVFCLVTNEELKLFPQFLDFRKADLLNQLAELEKEMEGIA